MCYRIVDYDYIKDQLYIFAMYKITFQSKETSKEHW